jgi:hypothetical protein
MRSTRRGTKSTFPFMLPHSLSLTPTETLHVFSIHLPGMKIHLPRAFAEDREGEWM